MENSIKLLLETLNKRKISTHVICPSATEVFPKLKEGIKDAFEILDERSAGYIATGMCDEINSPVVIWCADNESIRNLFPAITEGYYRKLPLLVVALSSRTNVNHSVNPIDTFRYYAHNLGDKNSDLNNDIKNAVDFLFCNIKGPVYFSLYNRIPNKKDYLVKEDLTQKLKIDVSEIIKIIPTKTCVHLGKDLCYNENHILNEIKNQSERTSQDGNLSMLIGSSLINQDQLHIGIFTEKEIVYDLNMMGNRHIGKNLIIINLCGGEKSSLINYAQKMQFEVDRKEFHNVKEIAPKLTIGNKPKYFEIVKI